MYWLNVKRAKKQDSGELLRSLQKSKHRENCKNESGKT